MCRSQDVLRGYALVMRGVRLTARTPPPSSSCAPSYRAPAGLVLAAACFCEKIVRRGTFATFCCVRVPRSARTWRQVSNTTSGKGGHRSLAGCLRCFWLLPHGHRQAGPRSSSPPLLSAILQGNARSRESTTLVCTGATAESNAGPADAVRVLCRSLVLSSKGSARLRDGIADVFGHKQLANLVPLVVEACSPLLPALCPGQLSAVLAVRPGPPDSSMTSNRVGSEHYTMLNECRCVRTVPGYLQRRVACLWCAERGGR